MGLNGINYILTFLSIIVYIRILSTDRYDGNFYMNVFFLHCGNLKISKSF